MYKGGHILYNLLLDYQAKSDRYLGNFPCALFFILSMDALRDSIQYLLCLGGLCQYTCFTGFERLGQQSFADQEAGGVFCPFKGNVCFGPSLMTTPK